MNVTNQDDWDLHLKVVIKSNTIKFCFFVIRDGDAQRTKLQKIEFLHDFNLIYYLYENMNFCK